MANTDTEIAQASPQLDVSHLSEQDKKMEMQEKTTVPSEGARTTEPQVREAYTWSVHTRMGSMMSRA